MATQLLSDSEVEEFPERQLSQSSQEGMGDIKMTDAKGNKRTAEEAGMGNMEQVMKMLVQIRTTW